MRLVDCIIKIKFACEWRKEIKREIVPSELRIYNLWYEFNTTVTHNTK